MNLQNLQTGTLPPTVGPIVAVLAGVLVLILLRGRLGRSLLLGLERVHQVCAVLVRKGLHPEELLDQRNAVSMAPARTETGETGERQQPEQQEKFGSEVFIITTRLLGLLFTLDVLLALLILDGIRTGIVVFQNEASAGLVKLPMSIPTVMGLLGWSMIVLMGSFLMELVMKRWPVGLEFLPPFWREGRASRILFRWLIGAGNVILFTYVLLLGLVAQLQLYHVRWPAAGVIVAALQMVLANLVGCFSLWVLVLGIGALFALGCLLVRLACALLHLLLRAWVQPERRRQTRAVEEFANEALLPERGKWSNEPLASGGADEREARDERRKQLAKLTVVPYQTTLLMAGESGRRELLSLADRLGLLAGRGAVRQVGYIPTKRPPNRALHRAIAQMGAEDRSITPGELMLVRDRGGDEVEQLLNQMRLKLQQHTPKVAGRELILVGLDWEIVPTAQAPLTRFARALPRHVIVPVVEAPSARFSSAEVQMALQPLTRLRDADEATIACSLLVDRQAPGNGRESGTGARNGAGIGYMAREQRSGYLARTLAGLMVAHRHFDENPTGADWFASLGTEYPFVSLAVGSTPLSAGRKLWALDPGRWSHGQARGRGDVEQTRESLTLLGERLLHDQEGACLYPFPGAPGVTLAERVIGGIVFIPFARDDHRFEEISEGLEEWASALLPGVSLVFVAGPGEPDEMIDHHHYFGQIAWVYGLRAEEVLQPAQTLRLPQGAQAPQEPQDTKQHSAAGVDTTQRNKGGKNPRQGGQRGRRTPLRAV